MKFINTFAVASVLTAALVAAVPVPAENGADLIDVEAREFADEVQDLLVERDFEDDVFERDFEDDLFERDFEEELLEREFEEELLERAFSVAASRNKFLRSKLNEKIKDAGKQLLNPPGPRRPFINAPAGGGPSTPRPGRVGIPFRPISPIRVPKIPARPTTQGGGAKPSRPKPKPVSRPPKHVPRPGGHAGKPVKMPKRRN